MAHEPGSGERAEVAPPRESTGSGKLQRTGYLALAASGLVLATAFGAVAQITGGTGEAESRTTANDSYDQGGRQLVPGQAVPGETTVMIDGVAVTGTLPPSTTSPTTVVRVGPDGHSTTTVVTPSRSSSSSSSSQSRSDSHTPGPTGSSSELPPTSTTDPTTPPPSTSDPTDPSEPTDPPTDPTDPTDPPSSDDGAPTSGASGTSSTDPS
ncbi:hypothetical protein BAY61_06685 [Prauserella marina]|uniref:Uncharacterized protein n=1 Tax=Prauserella marina TaxID=530584 RepID=A0A222VLB2_9PSEU|nr:hypothetical protein [Prauserella marina]ASR34716.1 hypothetical protein BAY61_06685 [Prauserella marina]PWV85620.1 hypothetical protein DES30_1011648 [Prauserella marina]SDC50220.1 hypothetical protein SAMN05421630_102343 [Prauserella marina]